MISIIVPVYNTEKYLDECIQSILSQTYTDFELLLINDGSTDRSGEICDAYALKDERIKVFHQQNSGQSNARNLGIAKSTKRYIMFVDSDDSISENLIKENLQILIENENIDFVQFPHYKWYGSNQQILCQSNSKIIDKLFFQEWLVHRNITWLVWDKIYKRDLFVNLKFKEGIIYEDNLMVAQLLEKIKKIYISDKGIYYYYLRENSTMTSPLTLKKEKDSFFVTNQITNILKSNNERELYLQFLVRCYNIRKSLKINYKTLLDFEFKYSLYEVLTSKLSLKDKIKLISLKYAN